MKTFRLMLLGSVVAGAGAMAATDASAGDVERSIKVSGHVNRAITMVDDGDNTYLSHVDNASSRSRFRVIGTAKSADVTVQGVLEFGAHANISNSHTQNTNFEGATETINLRKSEIYVTTKMGQVRFGQGYTAVDGAAGTAMSGTGVATAYGSGDHAAGGFLFCVDRQSCGTASTATGNPSINTVFFNSGDPSRENHITYWTPEIAGLTAGISHAIGGGIDAGLFYGAAIGGFKVEAALGYMNYVGRSETEDYSASAGILHTGTGINLSVGWGKANTKNRLSDMNNAQGSLGWRTKSLTNLGETRFSVDLRRSHHANNVGDRYTRAGFAVVQTIPAYGVEAYLGVDQHELDIKAGAAGAASPTNYDDITAGYIGARVKF